MNQCSRPTPLRVIVSRLGGLLVFLVVLVLLRFIAEHVRWPLFSGFVDLLFANVGLLVFISILFMTAEVFEIFSFPLNLPYPIFSAIASVLLVSFLLSILRFFDAFYSIGISGALDVVTLILLPLTFIAVLVAGYISIVIRRKEPEPTPAGDSPASAEQSSTGSESGTRGPPTWNEIGDEFRHMIRDLIRKIRNEINEDGKKGQ